MKFYSEALKQFFDTEADCLSAEETARQEAESKKATKAKYAKAVKDAEEALKAAYQGVADAKDAVKELQKEYDKKVDEIMDPALARVKECLNARKEAIKAFNEKYGTYTTTYTGNEALQEYESIMKNFFNRFYW